MNLTKQQRISLFEVYNRHGMELTYRQFRRTVFMGSFGAIMVKWSNMYLGIEKDGTVGS